MEHEFESQIYSIGKKRCSQTVIKKCIQQTEYILKQFPFTMTTSKRWQSSLKCINMHMYLHCHKAQQLVL